MAKKKKDTELISAMILKDSKPLITKNKKSEQLYFLLLSNHIVIIDTEFPAMRKYKENWSEAYVVEMLPTDKRLIAQVTVLDKLLENLDQYVSKKIESPTTKKESTCKIFSDSEEE